MKLLLTKMVRQVLAVHSDDTVTAEEIGVVSIAVVLLVAFVVLFCKATF